MMMIDPMKLITSRYANTLLKVGWRFFFKTRRASRSKAKAMTFVRPEQGNKFAEGEINGYYYKLT